MQIDTLHITPKAIIFLRGGEGGGSESAPSDNFENMDSQLVHSDAIWNDILELQRHFWKQGRACNLTLFETTRIISETLLKTMSLKHAFWRYLKRFGTAENIL